MRPEVVAALAREWRSTRDVQHTLLAGEDPLPHRARKAHREEVIACLRELEDQGVAESRRVTLDGRLVDREYEGPGRREWRLAA